MGNSHCNTDPKQQQQSHEPPRPALLLHHTILNPAPSSHLLVAMFIKSTLRTVSLVARQHQTRFLSTSVVSQSRRSLLAPLPSIITGSDSSVPRPSKEAMAAHYNQYLDVEEAEAVSPAATATATVAATDSPSPEIFKSWQKRPVSDGRHAAASRTCRL